MPTVSIRFPRLISDASLTRTVDLGSSEYLTVLKTHMDLIEDFNFETVKDFETLSSKHYFMISEYRKYVDIGIIA